MSPDNGHAQHSVPLSRVRVAVVGSGPFAELHAQAFLDNPDCELVGVVSRDRDRAAAFAQRYSVPDAASSLQELRASTPIDAVSVVTSGDFHLEPTLEALQMGASVLLEKPVVLSSEEGRVLRDAAASASGFVMPAHILRFAAPYQELRARVEEGAVGSPRALSFRRHRTSDHDRFFAGLHPVLMTMIHDIDLALWLTGARPRRVTARQIVASSRSQPLAVWAEVETTNGSALSFQVSWGLANGSLPDALEVIGTEGALSLSLGPRVTDFGSEPRPVDDCLTPHVGHGALREEVRVFVDAVRFGRTPTAVTLDEALAGIDLAEQIIAAAEANRIEVSP